MSKIYLVVSSCGEYDTYDTFNEKAFTSKEDAIEYAKKLDSEHFRNCPDFVDCKFLNVYYDICNRIPDRESYPGGYPIEDLSKYNDWADEQNRLDQEFIVNELREFGYNITIKMLEEFELWDDSRYKDWNDCTIEEIELL